MSPYRKENKKEIRDESSPTSFILKLRKIAKHASAKLVQNADKEAIKEEKQLQKSYAYVIKRAKEMCCAEAKKRGVYATEINLQVFSAYTSLSTLKV